MDRVLNESLQAMVIAGKTLEKKPASATVDALCVAIADAHTHGKKLFLNRQGCVDIYGFAYQIQTKLYRKIKVNVDTERRLKVQLPGSDKWYEVYGADNHDVKTKAEFPIPELIKGIDFINIPRETNKLVSWFWDCSLSVTQFIALFITLFGLGIIGDILIRYGYKAVLGWGFISFMLVMLFGRSFLRFRARPTDREYEYDAGYIQTIIAEIQQLSKEKGVDWGENAREIFRIVGEQPAYPTTEMKIRLLQESVDRLTAEKENLKADGLRKDELTKNKDEEIKNLRELIEESKSSIKSADCDKIRCLLFIVMNMLMHTADMKQTKVLESVDDLLKNLGVSKKLKMSYSVLTDNYADWINDFAKEKGLKAEDFQVNPKEVPKNQ